MATVIEARLKVLHLTLHNGCKMDFEEVAQELDLDLTSWYIHDLPRGFWEGSYTGSEVYNVGPQRAARIWNLHKDFFNSFDAILTSDTAPLSRILLQHGWTKPLIIWVCNRFDYRHGNGGEERFPDPQYYNLIRQAATMPNVRIVSYTPFEYIYGRMRGVDFGTRTIKPLGKKEEEMLGFTGVNVADKKDTLLLFPRLEQNRVTIALNECARRNIKVWTGAYSGPEDIKQFKGVLFFPYAFSNLALFENLQRGIVHFVPTIEFLTKLRFIRGGMEGKLEWCEWYFEQYKDVIVYFNSWEDLKHKVETTDYTAMSKKIQKFGQKNRDEMIREWANLFKELAP